VGEVIFIPVISTTFNIGLCGLQAAIEEGVVVGGGCSLLRLSSKVDEIKAVLVNEEQKVQM
jgi:chaperonin GroEL (HSP60 family)